MAIANDDDRESRKSKLKKAARRAGRAAKKAASKTAKVTRKEMKKVNREAGEAEQVRMDPAKDNDREEQKLIREVIDNQEEMMRKMDGGGRGSASGFGDAGDWGLDADDRADDEMGWGTGESFFGDEEDDEDDPGGLLRGW